MKRYKWVLFLLMSNLFLSACGIPGWGFSYASDLVDDYIGGNVLTVITKEEIPSGKVRLQIGTQIIEKEFYLSSPDGNGKRYFINFWGRYPDRCKYSLFIDESGIIKSWRDEGGSTHMEKCYVG